MNDPLVIHAGELIPLSRARLQAMVEFSRHGYQPDEIDNLLNRAVRATEILLSTLASLPQEQRETQLRHALLQERKAAEHWRAQWKTAEELLKKAEDRVHQEWVERKARERQIRLQSQFDNWEAHNEEVQKYNEAAPQRAAERKRIDDKAARRVIARIEFWQRRHRRRAAIDLVSEVDLPLSDHDYIEWRFRCASQPSRRWLAHCPIVRPAI